MMTRELRSGTSSTTHFFSQGAWRGRTVSVQEICWDEFGPCGGHVLWPLDEDFEDGGLYCLNCFGVVAVSE